MNDETLELAAAFAPLRDAEEMPRFLRDLCAIPRAPGNGPVMHTSVSLVVRTGEAASAPNARRQERGRQWH